MKIKLIKKGDRYYLKRRYWFFCVPITEYWDKLTFDGYWTSERDFASELSIDEAESIIHEWKKKAIDRKMPEQVIKVVKI